MNDTDKAPFELHYWIRYFKLWKMFGTGYGLDTIQTMTKGSASGRSFFLALLSRQAVYTHVPLRICAKYGEPRPHRQSSIELTTWRPLFSCQWFQIFEGLTQIAVTLQWVTILYLLLIALSSAQVISRSYRITKTIPLSSFSAFQWYVQSAAEFTSMTGHMEVYNTIWSRILVPRNTWNTQRFCRLYQVNKYAPGDSIAQNRKDVPGCDCSNRGGCPKNWHYRKNRHEIPHWTARNEL